MPLHCPICLRLIRVICTVPSSVSVFSVFFRVSPCSFLFCTDLTYTTDIFVRTRSVTDSLSICLRLIRVIRTVPSSVSVFSVYFRVRYLFSPFLKSFVVFFSISRAWPMHNMADDHAAGLPTHVFAGEPQKSHEIFAFLIFFSYLCSVFPEVGLTNDIKGVCLSIGLAVQ